MATCKSAAGARDGHESDSSVRFAAPLRKPDAFSVIPTELTEACWEFELGVIPGRDARHVREEHALDHVLGYTVFKDVIAMDEFRPRWTSGRAR